MGMKEIEILRENVQRARDRAFPGSINLKEDVVQESAPVDHLSGAVVSAQELIDKLENRLKTLLSDQAYAESVINKMDNPMHRLILTLYYLTSDEIEEEAGQNQKKIKSVYLYSWDDVAYKIGYNVNYTRVKHSEALEEFERLADL